MQERSKSQWRSHTGRLRNIACRRRWDLRIGSKCKPPLPESRTRRQEPNFCTDSRCIYIYYESIDQKRIPRMRKLVSLLAVVALGAGFLVCAGTNRAVIAGANHNQSGSSRPELEYLKAVNSSAPPQDPQLLFLLMGAYANANQQAEGAEFLTVRLNEFGPRLTDAQKSLYLSAIGLLRAHHASSVSLLPRTGYVKDTIVMLATAKPLSCCQIFVVNWISGVVRSQLPSFFHQRQAAQDDLTWCVANIAKAPDIGWLREANFRS